MKEDGNMKNILKYTMMLVLPLAFTACTEEMDEMMQPTSELQFVVGDFPAYGTDTRAIGTPDAGKTEWTNEDHLIVTIGGNNMADQSLTLTLSIGGDNSHEWTPDKTIKYDKKVTPELTVTAIYAPCYEVDADGNKVLKEGMQLGMTEYLTAHCDETDGYVKISFDGVTRDYSRLRIAGAAETTYTVSTEDFTPAGATTEATEDYTLTTDEIGNAYLYGTFAKDATVTVKAGKTELRKHTFTDSATEDTKSYVLDARPAYTYDETTKTYNVYKVEGLYAWNTAAQTDLSTNLTLMADIEFPKSENGNYLATDGTTEITLDEETGVPSGSNWTPISTNWEKGYIGTFDGNNHTITGLRINTEENYASLIGTLGADGEVKNLTLANAVVYGTGSSVSGFVAYISGGTISGCTFGSSTTDGSSVSGAGNVGGIIYKNDSGLVSYCTNNGTISASGTSAQAGGIAAQTSNGTVSNCTNNGSVSVSGGGETTFASAGGIVGYTKSNSTVSGCTNNGSVSATGVSISAGGIVGWNYNSTVSGCENTINGNASVDGTADTYVGGIVGFNSEGTVEDNNTNDGTPTTNVGNE